MPLTRSQRTNVYHFCARCNTRQPLSAMRWQKGQLVCSPNRCEDTALIGSREMAVAQALSHDRREGQPDDKLTNPVERRNDAREVLY